RRARRAPVPRRSRDARDAGVRRERPGHALTGVVRKLLLPASVVAGAAALVWLALPTVWWGPLNVAEELTLRLAQYSFPHIFHIVSDQRGGGPLHFWLEHFLLQWWPGLPALRVPSLVFACLALPGAALVVRRLAGSEAAAGAVLLTAVAPIPVMYAT